MNVFGIAIAIAPCAKSSNFALNRAFARIAVARSVAVGTRTPHSSISRVSA
jgi:hypothetical protein